LIDCLIDNCVCVCGMLHSDAHSNTHTLTLWPAGGNSAVEIQR